MDTDEIKVVHEFPRDVQEIENTFIPLADGIQLAARIWMPEDALERPVPAILEFLNVISILKRPTIFTIFPHP